MTNNIAVTKRDQTKEVPDLEKMHKVVYYACEGITGVSPSEVEIRSHISFYEGIETAKVQETLIKLYTHASYYKNIAKFSTWLYTIAKNNALTELRKIKEKELIHYGQMKESLLILKQKVIL